jgi:hypothetical protein
MVWVVASFVTIDYCWWIQSGIFTIGFDLESPHKKRYIEKYKLEKEPT